MIINLFILGRPGSGKSTAARYIDMLVKDKNIAMPTHRICDYTILQDMFKTEEGHERFNVTDFGGFDVCDLSVFDEALKEVEWRVTNYDPNTEHTLIIIEFARNDYEEALKQFNAQLIRNSYFLFLDADIGICMDRIHKRVLSPATQDDHFVSENILRNYYDRECWPYVIPMLARNYGIDVSKVAVIPNMGAWKEFGENVKRFIDMIFKDSIIPNMQRC